MPFPKSLPTPRTTDPKSIPVLRWGISGPGWIAEHFVNSLRNFSAQQVVAVESRDIGRARAFAERLGIAKAYAGDMAADPEVDVIYVATPHNHHFPVALAALKAGKHVLIEKPLALNAKEGEQLRKTAEENGVFLLEAFWTDFLPKFDVIRQLLDDGALGTLHTVIADHGEHFGPGHRILRHDLAGGPMLDLGSYLVALSVNVLGEPERIFASGQPSPHGVNGQASFLFAHHGGAQSVLHTTLFSNTPGDATIAGDAAAITIPGQFYTPGPFTLAAHNGTERLVWDEPRNRYDQLAHEANHVAWAIGQGLRESPIRPLTTSIATLRSIDEIRRQLGLVFNEERQTA